MLKVTVSYPTCSNSCICCISNLLFPFAKCSKRVISPNFPPAKLSCYTVALYFHYLIEKATNIEDTMPYNEEELAPLYPNPQLDQ